MAIYNAYLEGAEREAAIFNMEVNNQYEKLSMLYEMTLMELDQAKKDIELKVFKESGTYDDLEYLISEAEAQVAEDKEGVIQKLFKWFGETIQAIINGIKNLFTSSKNIDPSAEYEVPDDPQTATQNSTFNSIMNTINGVNSNNPDTIIGLPKTLFSIIAAVGAGATIATIFVVNRNAQKKKKKGSEIKDEVTTTSNQLTAIQKASLTFENGVNGAKEFVKKLPGGQKLGEMLDSVKTTCDNFLHPIVNFLKDKSAFLGEIISGIKPAASDPNAPQQGAGNGAATPGANTQNNGPVTINSATPDKGNSRIKVSVVDNSSGTPTPKTAFVNLQGKVIRPKDSGFSAAATSAIQNSQPVKDALKDIANAISNKAMNNSPQAQLATGPQVNTPAQNAAAQNAAKQAEKNKVSKKENEAIKNHPNAQFVNASAKDLQIELGDAYTVEIAEDGVIEITINETVEIPGDYLSTTESIFGMIAEEEASEDPELLELQKLFEEL